MHPDIENILSQYTRVNPYQGLPYDTVASVLAFAVNNDLIQIVETPHAYTFGGITIAVTDSQFAEIIRLLNEDRKITAIKNIRMWSERSLKDAKAFVDHLANIVSKI